ncbi:hypothetical protein KIN20_030054 [Parelaphostrongylus tenuis]|uniref:Uncharacterized protein n=1 Tax=Parelaphostrongylus tenuis TaxID=148309 RepID=A0AAD5R3M2_PARTN|nr:hypothetical protein KIN20_030054 [Parelaphostrongylus tenuis]
MSGSHSEATLGFFVNCVIDRMWDIDPNWQPPAVFRQWVMSWANVFEIRQFGNGMFPSFHTT